MAYRKLLIATLVLAGTVGSLNAAMSDELEIVASKPREKTEWQWHADLVNLYDGVSTLVNGMNIASGDQIEIDLASLPSRADGIWQDLFRFEWESDALTPTSLETTLSSFVDSADASRCLALEYRLVRSYSWTRPDGFSTSFNPSGGESRVEAASLDSYSGTIPVVDVTQFEPIVGTDGDRGSLRYTLTVSARFVQDVDVGAVADVQWVLPVSLRLLMEGE